MSRTDQRGAWKLFLLIFGLLIGPTALAAADKDAAGTANTLRILCLGDSLTEGYGVSRAATWPSLVEAELKERGYKNIHMINAGVSGSTTASGLGRLKWHLKGSTKPDILILALGANDGLRGLDLKSARQNLTDVIRLAKSSGIEVLLAGMQMPPNYGKDYTTEFREMFPAIATAEKVALIPFLLEGVAGEREKNLPDGIHPNETGYKIVAQTVLKYLMPLLPAKS